MTNLEEETITKSRSIPISAEKVKNKETIATQNPLPVVTHLQQFAAVKFNLRIDLLVLIPVAVIAFLSQSMLLFTDIVDLAKGIATSSISFYVLRRIISKNLIAYDYGSGKFQALGSLMATIILVFGLSFAAYNSILRLLNPIVLNSTFTLLGMGVQTIGLGLNSFLWRRNLLIAKSSASPLFEVQWRVNRADAVANSTIITGLFLTFALRSNFWAVYIDPIFALLFIGYALNSFRPVLKSSINDLLDKKIDDRIIAKIELRLNGNLPLYSKCHYIKTRKSGTDLFIDIGIEFKNTDNICQIASAIKKIKADICEDLPEAIINLILICNPEKVCSRYRWTPKFIEPLTESTLPEALAIINSAFDLTGNEKPELELLESVYPGSYSEELLKYGIIEPKYWVMIEGSEVIGISGVYFKPEDYKEAIWGGWTVFKSEYQNGLNPFKYLILRHCILATFASGRKYFRLYTTDLPGEEQANTLYEKKGFTIYKTERSEDDTHNILYRQNDINALYYKYIKE